MQITRRPSLLVAALTIIAASLPVVGQVTVATLPAGNSPYAVAVNSATNKIYVANAADNTVTVIDGVTNNTTTVNVGVVPYAVAVNSATNKIYVANLTCTASPCASAGTVTVIDGATNNTATVNVGVQPYTLGVNSVTNQIYVANNCGNDLNCASLGTVTVINGVTLGATTVNVGAFPFAPVVNSTTNQIYVANYCGNDPSCSSMGTVTAIDANNNNNTTTVNVGAYPNIVNINANTNQIYATNSCGNDLTCSSIGTVTDIDGSSFNTTSINVGYQPYDVEIDAATNMIYAVNTCGNDPTCNSAATITVINGANDNTSTVNVGYYPYFATIDSTANEIYVANTCGNDATCQSPGTVSAINGMSNAVIPIVVGDDPYALALNPGTEQMYVPNYEDNTVAVIGTNTKLQLVNVTPCRLVDTRPQNGGGGPIQGGTFQTFNLPQAAQNKGCANLSSAAAFSLNVTAVPQGGLGYLTIWPAAEFQPLVSTMNSLDGRIKADAVTIQAGVSGAVSVYVTNTANVVLDIDGYYTPNSSSTLEFYPLTPCRVLDTRNTNGPLGGPYLQSGQVRDFPVLSSDCQIPSSAQAYSMNFTVVPYNGQVLGYLTVWPTGGSQPVVSTLNNLTATTVANAAIVPAGTSGEISVYPSGNTQLVGDINGYFAAPGTGGQSLNPTAPCRVLDTRTNNGPFSGELQVDVIDSVCAPPSVAQAYVFNATVVPQGELGYLTLWPDGENRPVVSTLNAIDGAITSNMAIVPNLDGTIDAYASGTTDLILDIFSYFAP